MLQIVLSRSSRPAGRVCLVLFVDTKISRNATKCGFRIRLDVGMCSQPRNTGLGRKQWACALGEQCGRILLSSWRSDLRVRLSVMKNSHVQSTCRSWTAESGLKGTYFPGLVHVPAGGRNENGQT